LLIFRNRVANWVRDSFREAKAPPPDDAEEETLALKKSRFAEGEALPRQRGGGSQGAGYAAYEDKDRRAKGGLAKHAGTRGSPQLRDEDGELPEAYAVAHVSRHDAAGAGKLGAQLGQMMDNEEKEDDRASTASGSEGNVDASSAAESGDGEELTSDWR
jgi:hypothetical protein